MNSPLEEKQSPGGNQGIAGKHEGEWNDPHEPNQAHGVEDFPQPLAGSQSADDTPKAMNREAILAAVRARQKEYVAGNADAHGQIETSSGGFFARLDPEEFRGSAYIHNQPPPLDWLFEEVLLMGRVAFLCGPPGGGKSTFLIHLAASVTLGDPLFGDALRPAWKGKVLALFCEEDKRVLWNRVHKIFHAVFPSSPSGNGTIDLNPHFASRDFGGNLFAIPAAGQDVRLVQARGGDDPGPSAAYEELLTLAKSIDGLALIILDPLSRLYGQNENDNSTATMFCSLIERLGIETGAAVIVNHHVSKGAGSDKQGKFSLPAAMNPDVMRGASGLTGATRAQINLFPMPKEAARTLVKDKDARDWQYIAVGVTKNNDGRERPQFFLKRGEHGVLRPVDVAKSPEEKALFEQVKEKVIEVVAVHERDGKPLLTIKSLKDSYPAIWKDELPKVTKTVVESAANMAIIEGKLFLVERLNPGNRRKASYLSTAPGSGQDTPDSTIHNGQHAGRLTPDGKGQESPAGANTALFTDSGTGQRRAGQKDPSGPATRTNASPAERTAVTPKGEREDRPVSSLPSHLDSDGEPQAVKK